MLLERMRTLNNTSELKDLRFEMLTPDDVSEILGIKRSTAYTLIRNLNEELKAQGKFIMRGKISRLYFESKFFTSDSETK